jgi:hypothetical protein
MSKSQSSPTNDTSTSTNLTTKNLNVSGNSGFTAVGGEGGSQDLSVVNNTTTNNTVTDFGAIKAATGLSQSALDTVAAANRDSLDVINTVVGKSLTATSNAYGDALHTVADNADNTVSVVSNLATKFGTSLYDFTAQEQTQLGNVVSALSSTYQENTTNANSQVLDATQNILKYAVLAAVGIAALFFLTRK